MSIKRCAWVSEDPLYIDYHDHEWGTPIHDERLLFEFLILEGMQAGLRWITVLKKRHHFRVAFDNFDANKIAKYDADKLQALMTNPGIIRNRLKIQAVITNAQAYLQLQKTGLNFTEYLWSFVGGKPIKSNWSDFKSVPVSTPESDKLSVDLKRRGFKFVGTTICYAFMQAVGMVDDHTTDCFRSKA